MWIYYWKRINRFFIGFGTSSVWMSSKREAQFVDWIRNLLFWSSSSSSSLFYSNLIYRIECTWLIFKTHARFVLIHREAIEICIHFKTLHFVFFTSFEWTHEISRHFIAPLSHFLNRLTFSMSRITTAMIVQHFTAETIIYNLVCARRTPRGLRFIWNICE